MQDSKQKIAAKAFAEKWKDRGYEKGESQTFWLELLHNVLGVDNPYDIITFENQVQLSHTSFIDAYIIPTKVLIEQKSIDKDLRKAIPQSDGTLLTPFQQAKRYAAEMPYSKRPRWVVVCNFRSFLIYDMEQPQGEPFEVLLQNLEQEYDRLGFLVMDEAAHLRKEMEVSFKAGDLVGKLYEAFLKQYRNPESPESLRSLNILCVRLVFCLYSEDAGLFGPNHSAFYDYLRPFKPQHMRRALIDLFDVLDTPLAERDPYIDPVLGAFPYVAGGLFQEKHIEIPNFTPELADLLLERGSEDFDWADISPTIFGAVFESTLNPETRRSGGMHYTSIENIHKVIDPLFLDDLKAELNEIKEIPTEKQRKQKLAKFQDKLASLKFLDPACGSGNFLTETYLSLRRLENQCIAMINDNQAILDFADPIKVSINQFYGIEINDFAVTVAATALWIAEAQMWIETENIVQFSGEFLPLRSYSNIHEDNALRMDWAEEVIKPEELNYIMGNPPFVGARLMVESQKEDMITIFGKDWKNVGNMDYVCCWYMNATKMMLEAAETGHVIRTALVSTNSVSQGEQVANLWKPLIDKGIHIDFAWRTFFWDSEASIKAHVHCVIIGFSVLQNNKEKRLFYSIDNIKIAQNINGYLLDAPDVYIQSRSKTICDVPELMFGNMPNDGGFLSDYSAEEKSEIIAKYPQAERLFKQFMGATEFINKKERWCLWLKGVAPNEYRNIQPVMDAIKAVQEMRAKSNRAGTRKMADYPMLFGEIRQTDNNYLLIPRHSSENRRYIPFGYLSSDVICGDANMMIPDAGIYHFGIMESNVHMAWVRAVCGRIKSDYRYSKDVVYNNFPWPNPTPEQKARIEQTAQAILDARALYPDSSLADLYDEVTMPPELRRAHQDNDRAVMAAYGFPVKGFTESDCVARLFEMYQGLTK